MLGELRRLLEKHEGLTESDLRGAANALLTQQFLYLDNEKQLSNYRLVTRHLDYYRDLFDALGWQLVVDNEFGYVGVLPSDEESYLPLNLEETLFLFIAAQMFEDGIETRQTQNGLVHVSSEDMLARYESLTHRPRPKVTDFREILKLLQQHGLISKEEEDSVTKLPRISLLPALRQITGGRVLERLEAYLSKAKQDEQKTIGDALHAESTTQNEEQSQ